MKVYIVIWSDRHADLETYPFLSRNAALECAEAIAGEMKKSYGPLEEDEPLNKYMVEAGWIFYCCYSGEGDSVRVVEKVMDEGPKAGTF